MWIFDNDKCKGENVVLCSEFFMVEELYIVVYGFGYCVFEQVRTEI